MNNNWYYRQLFLPIKKIFGQLAALCCDFSELKRLHKQQKYNNKKQQRIKITLFYKYRIEMKKKTSQENAKWV